MNEVSKLRSVLELSFPTYTIYSGLIDEKVEKAISFIPNLPTREDDTASPIPFYSPNYTIYIQYSKKHSEAYEKAKEVYDLLYKYQDDDCYISAQNPLMFEGITDTGIQTFSFDCILYTRERG